MSKYLQNRGHKVTVFSFTGSHYLLLKKGQNITQSVEIHEDVKFIWLKSINYNPHSFITRIINWTWYNVQVKSLIGRFDGAKPDVIVFSVPSLHHLRLIPRAKRLFPSARIVLEIRDIWPLSVQNLGRYSSSNPIILRLKQAESIAFRNADKVIAVQPGIKKYVAEHYPELPIQNVKFIPHAFVPEEVDYLENKYEIGYAGTISRANDLKTLIKALLILKEEFGYEPKVLILGTGVQLDRIKKLAYSLDNVHFKGWVSRDEALNQLKLCRVCYDGLLNLSMYKYGFSRLKWVDYMLLKKPILSSYSGAKIDVDLNQIGWSVPAESPKLLAEKIMSIFKSNLESEIQEKGLCGYDFLNGKRHIDILGLEYEMEIGAN